MNGIDRCSSGRDKTSKNCRRQRSGRFDEAAAALTG